MTKWRNHPSLEMAKQRAQQKRSMQEREQQTAANVRKIIFDVFTRALADAPFISKVGVHPCDEQALFIERHEDKFCLRVFAGHGRATVSVTRVVPEGVYLPQYFGIQFYLSRMGKVRKSALILRKKLELFDVYQVTNS
jgi:hypothetical protein